MDEIKKKHTQHFFDDGATRFFNSRYPRQGYKVGDEFFFVTSEQFNSTSPRLYTVRKQDNQECVVTVGKFQQYKTRTQALLSILNGENAK